MGYGHIYTLGVQVVVLSKILYSRTYVKEKIYLNESSDASKELISTHLAIFEMSYGFGDRVKEYEYVASCITFMSAEKVPSGKKYSVT